jgi:hypothetical protein
MKKSVCKRETERQRDRETERQRERGKERQRDRETERQRGREAERQRDRETETQRDRETVTQTDRESQREKQITSSSFFEFSLYCFFSTHFIFCQILFVYCFFAIFSFKEAKRFRNSI